MELGIQQAINKALNEIELLEFELDECMDTMNKLLLVSEVVKKDFFIKFLKTLLPIQSELTDTDMEEIKCMYKEQTNVIKSVTRAISMKQCCCCDSNILSIIEYFIPYMKSHIKGIVYYRKSKSIKIIV